MEFRKMVTITLYVAAKSLQSCPTLCDPMDGSLPGSSIHGIFRARILEWGAIAAAAAAAAAAKSLQLCPTLCDPIDSSPPGSAVPGILQARTLECRRKIQIVLYTDLQFIKKC